MIIAKRSNLSNIRWKPNIIEPIFSIWNVSQRVFHIYAANYLVNSYLAVETLRNNIHFLQHISNLDPLPHQGHQTTPQGVHVNTDTPNLQISSNPIICRRG